MGGPGGASGSDGHGGWSAAGGLPAPGEEPDMLGAARELFQGPSLHRPGGAGPPPAAGMPPTSPQRAANRNQHGPSGTSQNCPSFIQKHSMNLRAVFIFCLASMI